MLRLEPRGAPSRGMVWLSPLLALGITVAFGVGIFLAMGKNPVHGLSMFFWEPAKSAYNLSELALKATPLILIGLGLAACYRSNVWNIGAEGQYILGAIFGGGVALLAGDHTSHVIVLPILLAGILGGMVWAALVAALRDWFNANEILVSLMLVYVAQYLLDYLVYGPWKDPEGYNFPQTKMFTDPTLLGHLIEGTRLNWGFPIALVAVALVWLFLFRSVAGFRLQVGGLAPGAARYAGYSSRKALWTVLLMSGGFAGLAGALDAIGPLQQLTPQVSQGYGFAAIIVAFVGRLNPVGIVLSGALMAMFYIGGELAQSRLGLPNAMTGVFQGLLLFSLLACDTLIYNRIRFKR
ncbi:ABC transporter permease [Thiomonas arsenitoxydans]|uniref:ABC transporter permease n=1 Tax=Thiomonas arsenitoxydans (strain DSM 22701 / CIP 110005 / 3As) TaxID=426114 RepID=UPI001ACF17D9|nr:ABC transporter permease [Thiomonas arsenitoxydans]MBN8777551.1 ABC transporter permease [Thiomonas arsenitoxydans]